jgi:hypothetical protein
VCVVLAWRRGVGIEGRKGILGGILAVRDSVRISLFLFLFVAWGYGDWRRLEAPGSCFLSLPRCWGRGGR